MSPPDFNVGTSAGAWGFSSTDVGRHLKVWLIDGEIVKGQLIAVHEHEIVLGVELDRTRDVHTIQTSQISEIHRRQVLWVPTAVISSFMVYGVLLVSGEIGPEATPVDDGAR